jgi:long-chain acyl-CoA synthetase
VEPTIAEVTALLTEPGAMFEIEERVIRGVPTRTWKTAPPSLQTVLMVSQIHGDKPFLVYEDERISFEQHFRQCARLARRMVDDWGLRKGDRVAIAMRNLPEWSLAFWASAAAGAVVVPLNAWWTGEELEYGLQDSGSRFLFCDAGRAERIGPRLGALALERIVVARGESSIRQAIPFAPLIADADADASLPNIELEPEDDATLFYTSGTTGRPKGALGTHRNICTNVVNLAFSQARAALRSGKPFPPPPDEPQRAQLLSVPFFHATGCHSVLAANVAFGGKLVLMHKWDPERALELIEREGITSFGGVPAMVWQVLESPSFGRRDLSSVLHVAYGGAPAAPELVRRIKEAFPTVAPGNGYGLTETSSVSTFNLGVDYERKPDSVGMPVPVCEVRIVGLDGADVATGEVGEIWIKGPHVVKGYWNNPAATAQTFTDGWLHSGDLGRVDEEGFVYVVDRTKDMLIRGGENIYCVEIESVLYDHPDVIDAAVVGMPHKVLGEEVGAIVQVRSGSRVTQEDLQRYVGQHLAAFKVPVRIDLRAEPLPRNPSGKILKAVLKKEMAS